MYIAIYCFAQYVEADGRPINVKPSHRGGFLLFLDWVCDASGDFRPSILSQSHIVSIPLEQTLPLVHLYAHFIFFPFF